MYSFSPKCIQSITRCEMNIQFMKHVIVNTAQTLILLYFVTCRQDHNKLYKSIVAFLLTVLTNGNIAEYDNYFNIYTLFSFRVQLLIRQPNMKYIFSVRRIVNPCFVFIHKSHSRNFHLHLFTKTYRFYHQTFQLFYSQNCR